MLISRSAAGALIALAVLTLHGAHAQAASIPWVSTYAAAQGTARQTHKLILVDFYATDCLACTYLDAVYKEKVVIQAADRFIPVRVDYERDGKDLADRYGVYGLPTVLFLDERGDMQGAVPGAEPAAALAADMIAAADRFRDFNDKQLQFKAHPQDLGAAANLASDLIDRGRVDEGEGIIKPFGANAPGAGALLSPIFSKLAEYYLHRNMVVDAAAWCQKIIAASQDPLQLSVAYFNMGVCSSRQGKAGDAISEWKLAAAVPGAPTWVKDKANKAIHKSHP